MRAGGLDAQTVLSRRGVRLCVDVTGDPAARPLVLLHALGLDKSSWDPVAPAFARTHRVYAADMRGFGDSDRPGRYSYAEMRDDVVALLDAIGAERADLIGHSMGGTVAASSTLKPLAGRLAQLKARSGQLRARRDELASELTLDTRAASGRHTQASR
jgi:pimeloyl-ACP methyl ester carboxylesterase